MRRQWTERRALYDRVVAALHPRHQRSLRILWTTSLVLAAALAATGVWQFFRRMPAGPFDGVPLTPASLHGIVGMIAALMAIFASAWIMARVTHSIPRLAIVTLVLIGLATWSGSLVLVGDVRIEGRAIDDEVERGYLQIFTEDIESVETASGDLNAWESRLVILAHIATLPLLAFLVWRILGRTLESAAYRLDNDTERTWFKSVARNQSSTP